jgi:phosphatidyl-myo-inositol dimannoside synthase
MTATDASASKPIKPLRALVLVPEAFGGYGGIAEYYRGLVRALEKSATISYATVLARQGSSPQETLSNRVSYHVVKRGGKIAFAVVALYALLRRRYDLLIVGHINFAALGVMLARWFKCKTVLFIHGGEAWRPRKSSFVNRSLARCDFIVAVSETTVSRFVAWTKIERTRCHVLPCCVDTNRFFPAADSSTVRERFGIEGKRVLLTIGRLATEERAKGFDEIIRTLPRLCKKFPDLVYVIGGVGNDRGRLQDVAETIGVAERVRFVGYIDEAQKVDFYRAADAFALPSRMEGFGIVLLEAVACGLPTLGSKIDGGREALLNGALGMLVDPNDQDDLVVGLQTILSQPKADAVPYALVKNFSNDAFDHRVDDLLRTISTKLFSSN